MSRPISPEQYEPSWNPAAQAESEARREQSADPDVCENCDHQRAFHFAEHDGVCFGPDCDCCEFEQPEPEDRTADGLLSILNGTVDNRRPIDRTPEHLRTDDLPSYLAAKGEGTGMRGW